MQPLAGKNLSGNIFLFSLFIKFIFIAVGDHQFLNNSVLILRLTINLININNRIKYAG